MQMRTLRQHCLATLAALAALSASADTIGSSSYNWLFGTSYGTNDFTFAANDYLGSYIRVGHKKGDCTVTLGTGATLTVTNARIGNYDSGSPGTAKLNIESGATFTQSEGAFFVVLDHTGYGYVNLNGGTMDVSAPIYIGGHSNSKSEFTVNSGTAKLKTVVVGGRHDNTTTWVNYSGTTSKFTVNGGDVAVTNSFEIGSNLANDAVTEVNLNGGTLTLQKFVRAYTGNATINFNGTTVKPMRATENFIVSSANLTCNIQSGNLIVDTDYDITIAADLTGVGGIVKKGAGKLTLSGNNSFMGAITVEEGAGAVVNNSVGPFVLDGSDGGDLGTVQLHGDSLEGWLADADITTFNSAHGGDGLHTYELPRIIAVKNGDTTVAFTNLEVGATVNWTAGDKSGTLTTESLAPRTIMIPVGSSTIANVRDMGGWPLEGTTTAGRTTVRQGQLFRGGRLDAFYSLTDAEKAANMLHTQLGVKTEIDLRGRGTVDFAAGHDILVNAADSGAIEDETYYFDNDTTTTFTASPACPDIRLYMTKLGDESMIGYSENYNAQIKRIFHVLGSSANYPAYFHCKIGSDRTGSIAFLVLGLCGVDEDYLYRDYLASTFANTETARTMDRTETFLKYAFMGKNTSTKIDWSTYASKYGDSLAGHVRGYLEFCGVTTDEMSALTTALTGETVDEVLARVNAYETAKGYKTLNFVAYPSATTTNATFRLASSLDAQVMTPSTTPSRSGYTFDGWDLAGAANGLVCAKWATESTTAIEWIGLGGDALWSTAANWDPEYHTTRQIRFASSAGNRKTATLDGNYNVSGNVEVTGGNATSPIIWTATDEAVAALNALTQTSTAGLDISGDLKVEKGIWNFANDIRVNNGGTLHVTGGRVTTKYWMPVSGDSSIVVDGGELVTGYRNGEADNGRINLGTTANTTVTLTQNGGRIRCANNTNGGNAREALTLGDKDGANVTVNLNGGEFVANGNVHLGHAGSATATLNLNGGSLAAESVRHGNGTGLGTINLNGGTLKALTTTADYMPASDYLTVTVGENGFTFDSGNYAATIAEALESGAQEGETDGGLVKLGMGTLWLKGETTYTGATVVSNGVLGVCAGHEFHGPLSLGEHATLAVDYDYSEEANLAVGDTIDLFKATELDLAEGDSLATTVVLTGAVIGYTIEQGEDGWVKARVTDVTNITSTRKVTVFLADNDLASGVSGVRYVDQDAAWDNKAPSANSFDVAVFPQDAMMCVYWNSKAFNNRAFGEVILRHSRLTWTPNAVQWPNLYVNHVGGVGALCLGRSGLSARANSALTVDAGVTIEANNAAVASNDNGWITTESGATATINGNIVATNGILRILGKSITINGDVTIGAYAGGTGDTDVDFTINGTWTIKDGANFKFDDKTVTMGENAKLVLEGTGKVTGVSGVTFPYVEFGAGCEQTYASGSIDLAGTSYIVDGGKLIMTTNEVSSLKGVIYKSGTIQVDGSAFENVGVGTQVTLPTVTLADYVQESDANIVVGGTAGYDWIVRLVDGVLTLTAVESSNTDNTWIGGAYGTFETAANWTRGTPTTDQCLVFNNAATVSFDTNPKVGTFVFNADVTFQRGSGGEKMQMQGSEGKGTLTLDNMGYANVLGTSVSISNNLNMINGAWFGDYTKEGWNGNISVYGNISGSGRVQIWGTDSIYFYGTNSAFTGIPSARRTQVTGGCTGRPGS